MSETMEFPRTTDDQPEKDWYQEQLRFDELVDAAPAHEQLADSNDQPASMSGKVIDKMESLENWLDEKSKASGEKSRAKSLRKGRGEKATERRARLRETLVKSGPYAMIGAAALAGATLTGGAGAVVIGASVARTGVRTSRGVARGSKSLAEGNGLTQKLETDSDDKRVQLAVKAANMIQAPERKATEAALNFMRKTDGEVTERQRLIAHSIGAVAGSAAMFGVGRFALRPLGFFAEQHAMKGVRFVDNHTVGTAQAETVPTTPTNPLSLDKPTLGTKDILGKPLASDALLQPSKPSLADQLTTAPPTIDKPTLGATDVFGKPLAADIFTQPNGTPNAPTGSSADHLRYNRFENHKNFQMDSVKTGKFDWKDASPAQRDAYMEKTIGNRPDLLGAAGALRDHGNVNLTEADINHRIQSYTVGGKNGLYSKQGAEAHRVFEKSWNNGKTAHMMSKTEVKDLSSRYTLVNHQTAEGKFANASDDTVSIAKNLNYRPELGDHLMMKQFGNGRHMIVKVNWEHPERHCSNLITLHKKPVEVYHPPVHHAATPAHHETTTQHTTAKHGPGHHETPTDHPTKHGHDKHGTHEKTKIEKGEKTIINKGHETTTDTTTTVTPSTETVTETPPATPTPPPPHATPPPVETPPPTHPPELTPKDPTKDINVNPDIAPTKQLGDQAGTIPTGPVTHPTHPQETYTPPPKPQPEVGQPAQPAPAASPNPAGHDNAGTPTPPRPAVTSSPDGPDASNSPSIPKGDATGKTSTGSAGSSNGV